jgi:hypothetical protein
MDGDNVPDDMPTEAKDVNEHAVLTHFGINETLYLAIFYCLMTN